MTENFPEDLAFAFLSDTQKKFIQNYDYDKIASFCAYQLSDFNKELKQFIV